MQPVKERVDINLSGLSGWLLFTVLRRILSKSDSLFWLKIETFSVTRRSEDGHFLFELPCAITLMPQIIWITDPWPLLPAVVLIEAFEIIGCPALRCKVKVSDCIFFKGKGFELLHSDARFSVGLHHPKWPASSFSLARLFMGIMELKSILVWKVRDYYWRFPCIIN